LEPYSSIILAARALLELRKRVWLYEGETSVMFILPFTVMMKLLELLSA